MGVLSLLSGRREHLIDVEPCDRESFNIKYETGVSSNIKTPHSTLLSLLWGSSIYRRNSNDLELYYEGPR